QSASARSEPGSQNLSVELPSRINEALDADLLSIGAPRPTHLRVTGGQQLSGTIRAHTSTTGAVALLSASLLIRGRTTLRQAARIVEVDRIVVVLRSIGVRATWSEDGKDLELVPPAELDLA